MALNASRTLLDLLEVVRPALIAPSFANLRVFFSGWVQTAGAQAVTEALVVTGVSAKRHHEAFHRFFSRGTWSPDTVARLIVQRLLRACGDGPIRVALDDTLAVRKGPHLFGLGCHLDAVRSTKRHKVFTFGHVWVVLAIVMPVPFSHRSWALPVLFRLYRNKKECAARHDPYRKKTVLAREMLDVLASWGGDCRVEITADSAYCNDTITRGLPRNFVLFGAMRPDAALTRPPPKRARRAGRPPKRGALVPQPEALAKNPRIPWQTCEAHLYGRSATTVEFKTVEAQCIARAERDFCES